MAAAISTSQHLSIKDPDDRASCATSEGVAYEVRDSSNVNMGSNLLIIHYGSLWKRMLDRLSNKMNGYVITVHHRNRPYRVYRIHDKKTAKAYPELRIVKRR